MSTRMTAEQLDEIRKRWEPTESVHPREIHPKEIWDVRE